jgi:membrane protein
MRANRLFRFFAHLNLATLRKVIVCAGQQRLPGLAAEMAYNAMLGFFPAILAMLTAIGLFDPLQATFQRLADQLSEVAPLEALTLIQDFASEISKGSNSGLFSLSFVVALWASSGALSAAMTALDQIHQIPLRRRRPFWKAKLISLGLTIGTIVLLLVACTLIFVSDLIVRHIANQSGVFRPSLLNTWRLLAWPLALGIVSSAFAFVYRFGPSRWNSGKPIFPGAILAATSWAIVSGLFRLYVSHFGHYNKAYGAIGAVIVLLLWLYMSSLIMLVGDQLNVTVGEAMQQAAGERSPSAPPVVRLNLNHSGLQKLRKLKRLALHSLNPANHTRANRQKKE